MAKRRTSFYFALLYLLVSFASLAASFDNNINDNNELTPKQQRVLNIVFASLMLICGPILINFGYRVFRIALALVGFVLTSAILYFALSEHTSVKWWLILIIAVAAGIIVGVIFYFVWLAGVFAGGLILGAIIGLLLLSTRLGTKLMTKKWTHALLVGLLSLLMGILAVVFQKPIIIFATSLLGSYMAIVAVDMLWVKTGVISNIISDLFKDRIPDYDLTNEWKVFILLGAIVMFTIIGILSQALLTSKGFSHTRRLEYAQIQEGNSVSFYYN